MQAQWFTKVLLAQVLSPQRNPTVTTVLKIENVNHLSKSENENSPRAPRRPPETLRRGQPKRLPGRVNARDAISLPVNASPGKALVNSHWKIGLLSKSAANYRRNGARLRSPPWTSQLHRSGAVKWLLYFKENYFLFLLSHGNKQSHF